VLAFVIDLVLVGVFVAVGRASHDEDPVGGFATTAWPFVAGLVLGWILGRVWRSPFALRWSGILVWFFTVAVGMLLRIESGQGVQLSFILVTAIVLAVFLLGWRALARLIVGRRSRRTDTEGRNGRLTS
jgi:peptidoglycan/LPS O-acetylase OafA/YrhL